MVSFDGVMLRVHKRKSHNRYTHIHSNICEEGVSCLRYDPHFMIKLGSGNVI